jgi:hypothetical protein
MVGTESLHNDRLDQLVRIGLVSEGRPVLSVLFLGWWWHAWQQGGSILIAGKGCSLSPVVFEAVSAQELEALKLCVHIPVK